MIGTLVDDLERLGYLRREPDPADRRAKRIVPTDLGLRQTSKIADAMTKIEHSIADDLGEQPYNRFKQTFEQVTERASAKPADHDDSRPNSATRT